LNEDKIPKSPEIKQKAIVIKIVTQYADAQMFNLFSLSHNIKKLLIFKKL